MTLIIVSFICLIILFLIFKLSRDIGVIFTILAIGVVILFELTHTQLIIVFATAITSYVIVELISSFIGRGKEATDVKDSPRKKKKKNYKKVIIEVAGIYPNQQIKDIRLGVSIAGSSGSGKTESPCYAIARHYAQHDCAGIIHDFKDFELTEMIYPLYKNSDVNFHIFAPLHPERSVRINPIDPKYITGPMQLNPLVQSFMLNLGGRENSNDAAVHFAEGAASLITAVIWRFKESFPEKCNWPYVISFLIMADHSSKSHHFGRLVDFIKESAEATALGSMFLLAINNEREIGSHLGTMSSNLKKLADPAFFYLLSANELDLDINAPNNRSVISFVNTPGIEQTAIAPILASIIEMCFQNMAVRGREPSFAMLDEAPRVKIMSLGSRVATLRSFDISFIYIMQDVINQAKSSSGGKDYLVKEIISNLSTQFFGKANDPESSKYYESFFPIIKEKTTSTSSASNDIFGTEDRKSVGSKDVRKVLAQEFQKLQQGEFYLLTGGEEKKIQFKNYSKNMVRELPPILRPSLTKAEMLEQYNYILQEAKTCFYT